MKTSIKAKAPKQNSANNRRGMQSVKGAYERPSGPLTIWIKGLSSTIEFLPITLDFMMREVFRPAGVSDVSAYLLFERWVKGQNTRLNKYGKLQCADKTKGVYHFYPVTYQKPKPAMLEVRDVAPTVASVGIKGVFSDIGEIRASLGLLMEAVATLTDKVNALATTKQ